MRWTTRYALIKADPERYAAYLERKRQERLNRVACCNSEEHRDYEKKRKAAWRASNPGSDRRLRLAHRAVYKALRTGKLKRSTTCEQCGASPTQAHHHNGYAKEYWLDVVWLCVNCHAKEHRT